MQTGKAAEQPCFSTCPEERNRSIGLYPRRPPACPPARSARSPLPSITESSCIIPSAVLGTPAWNSESASRLGPVRRMLCGDGGGDEGGAGRVWGRKRAVGGRGAARVWGTDRQELGFPPASSPLKAEANAPSGSVPACRSAQLAKEEEGQQGERGSEREGKPQAVTKLPQAAVCPPTNLPGVILVQGLAVDNGPLRLHNQLQRVQRPGHARRAGNGRAAAGLCQVCPLRATSRAGHGVSRLVGRWRRHQEHQEA